MALLESFNFLVKTINERERYKHKSYVDEQKKIYKAIVTGNGIEMFLKRNKRQSEDEYKEKIAKFKTISPTLISSACKPFSKSFSSTSTTKVLKFIGEDKEAKRRAEQLNEKIGAFHGTRSVDDYINYFYTELNKIDPNGYIAIHFDDPNDIKPYPSIVKSESIINKRHVNGIIANLIQETEGGFLCYGENENILLEKVKEGTVISNLSIIKQIDEAEFESINITEGVHFKDRNSNLYKITLQVHELPYAPVLEIGSKLDQNTDFETFVPIWWDAFPYVVKLVRRDFELDLSYEEHCFPQRIVSTEDCNGEVVNKVNRGCINGKTHDEKVCGLCKGTGRATVISSADDTLYVRMPKFSKGEEQIDITKIIHYQKPDVSTLSKLEESISEHLENVSRAIFNSNSFSKETVNGVKSSEEIMVNYDNIYDTLLPFNQHVSYIWAAIHRIVATLTSLDKDLIINHHTERDLKFKNINEYITDLKLLNESNAPAFMKIDVNSKIAEIMYRGNEEELMMARIKMAFTPFAGKSETQIIFALTSDNVCRETKVLYENIDNIFDNFEHDFYKMEKSMQKSIIDKAVADKMVEIDKSKPTAQEVDFNANR